MKTSSNGRRARSVAEAALSQAFSAGSNFVIILGLGRGGGEKIVGDFVLAFVVYNSALGLQRALITDALLARPFRGERSIHTEDARAVTLSLLLGAAAAAVSLVAGLITPFHQLVWLAPFLPVLLLQDVCRYLLFRREKPTGAAFIDGIWAAVSCVAFFYLTRHPSSRSAIILWGSGGLIGALAGVAVVRISLARIRESLAWWRMELWVSSRWLTFESVVFHADQQATAFGFTAAAGGALFGEWQITQSLLGIAAFLNVGLIVMSVTHFSRQVGNRRAALMVSLVSFSFAALLTVALILLAPLVVPVLYAGKVNLPSATILPTGLFLALGSAAAGPISLLRARRREKILPIARMVALVAFTPLAIFVAADNFHAALWLLAGGSLTYLVILAMGAYRLDGESAVPAGSFDDPEVSHELIA